MSFKKFSAAHGVPVNDRPDDTSKDEPATVVPVTRPDKTPDEVPPAAGA